MIIENIPNLRPSHSGDNVPEDGIESSLGGEELKKWPRGHWDRFKGPI